jgi:hypothetical protein
MSEVAVTPCTLGPRVRLTIAPATRQLKFALAPKPRLQFILRRGGNCSAAISPDGNFVHFTFNGHTVRVPRDDV